MAFESNIATFIGNLTDDPELRFTGDGTPVASMRVASNRKYTDGQGNEKEDTTFLNVNLWRDMAENASESLSKGDRVIVIGRLRVRSYEKEGNTVWVTEIEADEVAPSLRWAQATVTRQSGKKSGGAPKQDTPPPPPDDDVPF